MIHQKQPPKNISKYFIDIGYQSQIFMIHQEQPHIFNTELLVEVHLPVGLR